MHWVLRHMCKLRSYQELRALLHACHLLEVASSVSLTNARESPPTKMATLNTGACPGSAKRAMHTLHCGLRSPRGILSSYLHVHRGQQISWCMAQ